MQIHGSAVLDDRDGVIEIGEGTEIGAFCYIKGPIFIGRNNRLNPHVVLGTDAESRKSASRGAIHIGDGNIFSDFAVVHRGTGSRETTIGSNCFLMHGAHVAHDCVLEDDVTFSPHAVVAGHVTVLEGSTLGMNSSVHQRCTIGQYSMLGMGAAAAKDLPPFGVAVGVPARMTKVNGRALEVLGYRHDAVGLVQLAGAERPQITYDGCFSAMIDHFLANARREAMAETVAGGR